MFWARYADIVNQSGSTGVRVLEVSQQVGRSPQGYTISHTWQNTFEVDRFQSGAVEGIRLFKFEIFGLKFQVPILMWGDQLSLSSSSTQDKLETQLMGLSSIVMSLIGPMNGVFEMSITSDLTGWMNIELNLDQVISWCKRSCMWIEMESVEFPIIKAVESSSNISNFESRDKGRSFVKTLKSLGPNKEPWARKRLISFTQNLYHW